MAAAAAMVLASCEKVPGGSSKDNAPARMNVRISFPQSMGGTRATDSNASAKDVEVEEITVFIFDEDGNAVLGNATTFDVTDFTGGTNNVYELNPTNRIQTVAGPKHVYVGINLPSALVNASSESVLIDAASTVGLVSDTSLAMLSGLATPTLVAQQTEEDSEETPNDNIVAAEVKRLVSKIAVTLGEEEEFEVGEDSEDVGTYRITPDMFAVGGLATTFYPVERIGTGMLKTPGDPVDDTEPVLRAINGEDTDPVDLDAFYVPEHAPNGNFSEANLTYVLVRAEVTFTKWATANSDLEIVLSDFTGPLAARSSVWVTRVEDNVYFSQTAPDAKKIRDANVLPTEATTEYTVADDGKIYTYYHIYPNGDTLDPYAIHRNQFLNIKVTGASGMGRDTTTPPDEPLVETTYLEVSVEVLNWDYKEIEKVLGE